MRLVALDLAPSPDVFRMRLAQLMRDYFARGVPSFFTCVRFLYPKHAALVEAVVRERIAELRQAASEDAKVELSWALFFLAQHLDKMSPGVDVRFLSFTDPPPPPPRSTTGRPR